MPGMCVGYVMLWIHEMPTMGIIDARLDVHSTMLPVMCPYDYLGLTHISDREAPKFTNSLT